MAKKNTVTNNEIDQILNPNIGIDHWELMLGIGLFYENREGSGKASAPYMEYGKDAWRAFRYDMYTWICNPDESKPKEWVADVITGDFRTLIVNFASLITSRYNVSLAIGLPIAALVIKTGFLKYCEAAPKKPRKSLSSIFKKFLTKEILLEKPVKKKKK